MDVQGIILAAGLSSRAKSFKMTLEFGGKTVIENTIDSMLLSCTKVFVVGGFQIERLQPIIKGYDRVELINNENYSTGMFSSVKKGIDAISASRFFLAPGDCPLISAEVYQELLKYKAPVVIPSFEGKKGHPILAESDAVIRTMRERRYETLRDVISDLKTLVIPVDCRGVIEDLDTMEDYEMLQKRLNKEVSL